MTEMKSTADADISIPSAGNDKGTRNQKNVRV